MRFLVEFLKKWNGMMTWCNAHDAMMNATNQQLTRRNSENMEGIWSVGLGALHLSQRVARGHPSYWNLYIVMCVVQWVQLPEVAISTSWLLPTTWVDMDISIWWGTSRKLLKSSKSFRTRLRISSARLSSFCDLIVEVSTWARSLMIIWKAEV